MRKAHLHEEQFDGHWHAACARVIHEHKALILGEDEFSKLPRARRCTYCTRINWPKGFGDPQ